MNSSDLLDILTDWNYWGNYRIDLEKREFYLKRINTLFSPRTALTLLGIRRAGKSSLFHLYLQDLFSSRLLEVKDSLIVNLEDPRFTKLITAQDLYKLFEIYQKNLSPINPIVVLDEVQNVEGWERFVHYLLEAKRIRVIITGSSSKLLDREISTVLTGRHVDIEVFPLNFKELLRFRRIDFNSDVHISKNKIAIERVLDGYLKYGGFPEVNLCEFKERKQELLFRYFDDIIFKDLVKRFNIKSVYKLEQMANILITNISTLQSYNSLKTQLGLSLDTVERFAHYFKRIRMFFFMKKYDYSIGKQIRSIHKVYLADNGFYYARGFRFSENIGRLVENIVAIELYKKQLYSPGIEFYYWRDNQQREVDFVVKEAASVRKLIQVCWNISNPRTLKREVSSLVRAGHELDCNDLLIINEDVEDEKKYIINNVTRQIRFVPLWKWLLFM